MPSQNPEIDTMSSRKPVQAFLPFLGTPLAAYPLLLRSWATTAGQILILTMLVALSACVSNGYGINWDVAAPADPAERFAVLAFQNEWGEELILSRFEEPVRVYGNGGSRSRIGMSDVVVDLAAATGHDIQQVWAMDEANIVVTVAPWPVIEKMAAALPNADKVLVEGWRFNCAGFTYRAPDHSIHASRVFIDADLGRDEIRRCMMQEVAQSLGLFNDINDPAGTIFSSGGNRHALSAIDYAMLGALYDARLWVGMTREEAMPIVREILQGGTT